MAMLKRAVSKKKRRFQEQGFDLDLSYITDRVIAMGFPSEKMEGVYRNSMSEVVRFLDNFHKDKYRVYNLCSERQYDPGKFYGRVCRFPFDDHNPPALEMIQPFCQDVERWFMEDEENVAVIHCKAGKGRTGVMIACWLLYCRMWPSAVEALRYYGAARTKDQKGVTIASQIRYVHYFSTIVNEGGFRSSETMFLKRVRLNTLPKSFKEIYFSLNLRSRKVFTSTTQHIKKDTESPLDWDINAPLVGDVHIIFYNKPSLGSDAKIFHFWVNTSYIDDGYVLIPKLEMDKGNKDKKHKLFLKEMSVELFFDVPIMPTRPIQGARMGTDAIKDAVVEDDEDDRRSNHGSQSSADSSDEEEGDGAGAGAAAN